MAVSKPLLSAVFALVAFAAPAFAQDWPARRAITMVVPFAAGGPVDTVGRILASGLSETLGQQVIVENVGGAGGMTGGNRVAKAAPDGYVFLLGGSATLAFIPTLYKKPLYDAVADFAPVALVADSARLLIARKDFPANTLAEFIAYAKANQEKMQYGSAGAGSGAHVCAILLDSAMGTQITHVPYRGTGPAMQDLLAGRLDFICEQISTMLPQIRANKVKAIATLGLSRAPGLANLPTAHEQGLAGFDCSAWAAIVYPNGTPEAIIRRLAKAASETVDRASVRARLETVGVTVPPPERRSTEYLAKHIPSEIEKWAGPIKASGVPAD
jgi:tripartite-type tricarboxylate transporter receptor subunit TctC